MKQQELFEDYGRSPLPDVAAQTPVEAKAPESPFRSGDAGDRAAAEFSRIAQSMRTYTQADVDALKAEVEWLKAECDECTQGAEVDALKAESEHLRAVCATRFDEIDRLETENRSLECERDEARAEVERLRFDTTVCCGDVKERLEEDVEVYRDLWAGAVERTHELQRCADELQQDCLALTDEVERLKAALVCVSIRLRHWSGPRVEQALAAIKEALAKFGGEP